MTLDDLDEVLEIERVSFLTPWSRGAFRYELTQNRVARSVVVRLGRQLVGYLCLWEIGHEIHITNLAVHPSCDGAGGLLARCSATCWRARAATAMELVFLEVRPTNRGGARVVRALRIPRDRATEGVLLRHGRGCARDGGQAGRRDRGAEEREPEGRVIRSVGRMRLLTEPPGADANACPGTETPRERVLPMGVGRRDRRSSRWFCPSSPRLLRLRPRPRSRAASTSSARRAAAAATPEIKEPVNAGGRRYDGPFGTVYSSNITPDRETGIGAWTDEQIITAIRLGRRPNGERMLPVHPYTVFNGMAAEDLRALVAYLRTVPAVNRPTPAKKISVPLFESVFLPAWLAAFAPRETPPPTAPTAGVARGEYLVRAVGHCGECHTPRTITMATDNSRFLAGAPKGKGPEGAEVPNITPGQGDRAHVDGAADRRVSRHREQTGR